MSYSDTVSWMFKQLPMYQHTGASAYKKDLSNTLLLAEHLGNPQNDFKSIHVAGTNGKGSTSHMLSSILQESGYKVGLYTSPHLKDFRERIKINGEVVTEDFVVNFIDHHKSFFEAHSLSFFEMTVGMAFDYFSEEKVDIAVIEVGMGGRLDSTNIITPEVSVITNIGLDHVQFLGDSLEAIASEKAGIIKERVPVVVGETQKETMPVFNHIASAKNAPIFFADQLIKEVMETDLKGIYQTKNIKTVVQSVKVLAGLNYNISEQSLRNGLLNVVRNTGLLGRWQQLGEDPAIICDTAHNKEGLTHVVEQLIAMDYDRLHIVFGVVKDKDVQSIIHLMPENSTYYFCKPNIPRGMDVKELKGYFEKYNRNGKTYASVKKAVEKAKENAGEKDLIFVGGSTFVVAEVV